ncbi:hypothetical protein PC120_g21791 [Phytophthora cactorum]|nr:hypothetical protein PC120_g21791 [Phytophthora cactorum]
MTGFECNSAVAERRTTRTDFQADAVPMMMRTVPHGPDASPSLQLVRQASLEIVSVRCQHIVDWELNRRRNIRADVFKDPPLAQSVPTVLIPNISSNTSVVNIFHMSSIDSDDTA